jgi:hypothetical protein
MHARFAALTASIHEMNHGIEQLAEHYVDAAHSTPLLATCANRPFPYLFIDPARKQ